MKGKTLAILMVAFLGVGLIGTVAVTQTSQDPRSKAFDSPSGLLFPTPTKLFPQITAVSITTKNAEMVLQWVTTEPTQSYVEYGTEDTQLTHQLYDSVQKQAHEMVIPPLQPRRHYFRIRAVTSNRKEVISPVYNYRP